MAVARVVTFEGVDAQRMEQLTSEVEQGGRPEEIPASEIVMLHDPESSTSQVILFFDSEEDYQRGDAALNAMPSDETPGRRTSVKKYNVAMRMSG